MSNGLTHLSDDELTRLRSRIETTMRTGNAGQRSMAMTQLEAVDLESEHRLSTHNFPIPTRINS